VFLLENERPKLGNRTRVEILSSILNVAERGALKTHIMYKANLSHTQLERYLAFLKENGLLEEVSDTRAGTRLYHATEKGIAFLKDYWRLSGYFLQKDAEVRI
jgi:predicted transcriptional regulator